MLKAAILGAVSRARIALQDLLVDCKLYKRGAPVHVPGSPVSYAESAPIDVKLAITDYEVDEIDGDRVRRTDKKGILLEPSTVFSVNDRLFDGTSSYRVQSSVPYMVGNTPAATEIHLRPM